MGSRKKIGVEVDEDLWERFKNYVQDVHGRTRGVTAAELEKAIENHISGQYPTDKIHVIENDVATTKALVADLREQLVESDGGEIAIPDPVDDPAPTPSTDDGACVYSDDAPSVKATRRTKVDHVFGVLCREYGVEDTGFVVDYDTLREHFADPWGISDRTVDDLIDLFEEAYEVDAVRHPDGGAWHVAAGTDGEAWDTAVADWLGVTYDELPSTEFNTVSEDAIADPDSPWASQIEFVADTS